MILTCKVQVFDLQTQAMTRESSLLDVALINKEKLLEKMKVTGNLR